MNWPRIALPWNLRDANVMGMNERNIKFISRYNERKKYPLVDNKLLTKKLALASGIHTPDLIGMIDRQSQVSTVHSMIEPHQGFVIKPAQGSGGKGILVVEKHHNGAFTKPSGSIIDRDAIERHISNGLAGLFSLGGRSDVIFIESLVKADPMFKELSFEGVPDIRIIVFQGYPVMAMIRLSTHESDGKANLHQGAVGVGLNLKDGSAIHGVQFNRPIKHHPDTNAALNDINIPHWHEMLTLACRCYEMTGLGYLGVDMILDKEQGPLLLELNARPGLAIQIANGKGLKARLKRVEAEQRPFYFPSVEERIQFAQQHLTYL